MQLGSPNSTYDCFMIVPGDPFILGSEVKVMSHKNIAGVGLCTLVSEFCKYFVGLILVNHYHLPAFSKVACRANCQYCIHLKANF